MLILTVLLIAVLVAPAFAQQAAPASIAVVDVQKVLNNCKEKAAIDADITTATETLKAEVDGHKHELRQLESDLELLDPGSAAWKAKREEIDRKIVSAQVGSKYGELKIAREQILRYENLYNKLREACAEVAKANGYNMVLTKDPAKLQRSQNANQLVNQIASRKMLWAADDLEITDEVLQKMNTDWEMRDEQ